MTSSHRVSVLIVLALAACGRGDAASDAAIQPEVVVGIGMAEVRPFREVVTVLGTVVGRPGRVAALGAPAPTRVSRVAAAIGDRVKRGAPLIEFEQAPFAAELRSAEAQHTAASRGVERARRLVADGIMSRRELEQAESALEQARATLVVAQRSSELSVLRAPFDGVVTRMDAVLGSAADANQVLAEIADPSALDVLLRVTPGDAARVRPGARVTLTRGEGSRHDSLGVFTVVEVAGAVDSATRAVVVRARGSAAARALRIGETIYGAISVGERSRAVTVAAAALVPEGDRFHVFVVDSAGVAHARRVTVGARADSIVEILEGLSGGERIVTAGAFGVSDSSKVVTVKR